MVGYNRGGCARGQSPPDVGCKPSLENHRKSLGHYTAQWAFPLSCRGTFVGAGVSDTTDEIDLRFPSNSFLDCILGTSSRNLHLGSGCRNHAMQRTDHLDRLIIRGMRICRFADKDTDRGEGVIIERRTSECNYRFLLTA